MRLALARALFVKPDLLMLDEPSNMLGKRSSCFLARISYTWKLTLIGTIHMLVLALRSQCCKLSSRQSYCDSTIDRHLTHATSCLSSFVILNSNRSVSRVKLDCLARGLFADMAVHPPCCVSSVPVAFCVQSSICLGPADAHLLTSTQLARPIVPRRRCYRVRPR